MKLPGRVIMSPARRCQFFESAGAIDESMRTSASTDGVTFSVLDNLKFLFRPCDVTSEPGRVLPGKGLGVSTSPELCSFLVIRTRA